MRRIRELREVTRGFTAAGLVCLIATAAAIAIGRGLPRDHTHTQDGTVVPSDSPG